MISTAYALIALMSLTPALAVPVTTSASSAALFFMTNDPSGNHVVVNSLASSGKVSFVKSIATGGIGATGHGGGPDALFSQDSVLVSHNNLFVVNPGSNTLSAFSLEKANPTSLRQVGKAVSTSGEFPVAVARSSSKHQQVCVANGGAVNGVACFHMSNTKGLTPLNNTVRALNINQTTPATGPAGTVSDILFSEDGKKLLVSVKGSPPTPGFIAQWDVAADGSLSESFTSISATAGGLPFGIDIIPGKNAIIATDPAVGASTFSLGASLGSVSNSTNISNSTLVSNSTSLQPTNSTTSTTAIPINGQGAVCWVARSKKTGSFFVTDILRSTVTEIAIDDNLAGKIVKQYPQTPGSGTIDDAIGSIKGKDFLYVLATNATSPLINVLSVGSKAGEATSLQTFDVGAALKKANTKFVNVNMQGMAVYAP